jgi:hypothetical protein
MYYDTLATIHALVTVKLAVIISDLVHEDFTGLFHHACPSYLGLIQVLVKQCTNIVGSSLNSCIRLDSVVKH